MASSIPSTSSLKFSTRLQPYSRPQKRFLETDTKAISHSVLAEGAEHVVSYGGTGQYGGDGAGVSACGLAALNFARVVFSIEQDGLKDEALLQAVLARECIEETTAICALWSGSLHLEVEDICRVPLFEKTLKLKTTTYGHPGVSEFKSLLAEMSNLESSAVSIITRPPEIIACLKLRIKPRDVFIIFDSHPRPSYPNGAGMTVNTSIEGTARRLTELLPTVDLPDSFLQWQAQLLANYSGHVFVPHGVEMSTPTLWQAVLESSLAQLSMQAELAELRSQTDLLKSEQQRLESEIKEAEVRSRRQERLIQQLEASAASSKYDRASTPPRHMSSSSHHSYYSSPSRASTSSSSSTSASSSTDSRSSLPHGNPGGPPTPRPTPPFDHRDDGMSYAMRLQREFDEENYAMSTRPHGNPGGPSTPRPAPPFDHRDDGILRLQREFDKENNAMSSRPPGNYGGPSTPPFDHHNDGVLYAMRLQREFDEENHTLSTERTKLAKSAQRVFKCSICMEELPVDSIARVDTCGHTFCRECLRGHVSARLDEHRFPVICPSCTADKGKGKGKAGEVSQSLALNLGLTDEQFSIWTEMEMVSFSILLHCRKCQRSMFVARDEHEEASIIACPLPDCTHAWCKQCQQSINFDGPKHSCDGSSELNHLMKEQGWKHCPTCKTPVQKESGCNHMTCISPACNTHFCYVCGGLIVRSGLGQDIEQAVSNHYLKNCKLFHYNIE